MNTVTQKKGKQDKQDEQNVQDVQDKQGVSDQLSVADSAEVEDVAPMSRSQQRKLFASARSLGLTDQERVDLAEVILRRDVTSWKDFSFTEAGRLIDAFEGYEKITWLLLSRDE